MPVSLICTFLWIGFVCAISFMEAWLKFRAPGITVPLGLGIGRIVFGALNKVEWFLSVTILLNLIVAGSMGNRKNITLLIPVMLLVLQTVWLLPVLDSRAQMHIDGSPAPSSNLHFYYVGMEVVKIVCLFFFGISLLQPSKSNCIPYPETGNNIQSG